MPSDRPASPSDRPRPEVIRIAGRQIEPGDYLPPQEALNDTCHQHDGFTVGGEDRDVLPGLAVIPGHMQLYGPAGTLDSVAHDAQVTVCRGTRTAPDSLEAG